MAYFPGDNQETEITQFKGSAQAVDPYALDPAHGLYSQNIDFVVGPDGNVQASTRRGVSQISQIPISDGAVTSLASWYFTFNGIQNALVIYYAPAVGVKFWSQAAQTFSSAIIAVTGAAYASFAFNGVKGIVAFGNSTGRVGTASGYITDASNSALTDTLFAPPLAGGSVVTMSANVTFGAGNVTAGNHRVGFLYTTRNGYTGPLSPVQSNGQFGPYGFVAPDGVHEWQVSITFVSIPSYLTPGGTVQIVMSTAANPARYYAVPGATANVPGSPGTVNIIVNISDGDLTATGTDVTFYQNLLTQSLGGTPPFDPFAVFGYSSRMGYCTYDASQFPVVYFSDQNAYQSLTAAYHGVYLENRQIPVQGASLGAICYIATMSGLYACQDNGGYPVTWTPPSRVDGSVGILAPSNMLASGGKLILASEKGAFIYRGGSFPAIPFSYWQAPDWNRINWSAPTQVQIVDDEFTRKIRIIAPLKVVIAAATNANPIAITTAVLINGKPVAYPHLFQTGMSVTITGITGNTAANTTATITVTGANTFTIPVAGNGTYTPTATSYGTATPNAPNAEMSWCYVEGEQPGQMYYSLNAFSAYRMGAIATVRNISNNIDETWYAPAASNPGGIIRRVQPTDQNPYRDVDLSGSSAAISAIYETGIVPGTDPTATVHDFHGAHFRVQGNGTLALTAYGIDHVRSVVPTASPITLSQTPGLEVLVKWFLRNEQQSIQISTNAVDAYFVAALIRAYWNPSLPFR